VHLFYLVREARGTSAGAAMHDHVTSLFDAIGIRSLRLSVSPTNARAIAYYRKHGWEDLGPRPGHEGVNLMGLEIVS
jgi:ribosomal protein S18 acetylase RimI-like enzyme